MAANAVAVLDTSDSMRQEGYVAITKRDAAAFVSYARTGDGIGVVSYDVTGRVSYPPNSTSLAIVDSNLDQNKQAVAAIEGLSFTGRRTCIGCGIQSARTLLDSAADPRGMVLLSDGYQNHGTNPLDVLPSYPVYTCAMGPDADHALMQQIAQRTNGQYYNAPYPSTMMLIFNDIRAQPASVQLVQNVPNTISNRGFKLVPATLSGANSESQFGVVWDDDSLAYTNSPNPSLSQISVTMVEPSGQISPVEPAITGKGYAVFNVTNPASGTWQAQVISGTPVTVRITTGAFEFPADPANAIQLHVDAPELTTPGEPLSISASVTDHGEPIKGLKMIAAISRPIRSLRETLNQPSRDDPEVEHEDSEGDLPREVGKLRTQRAHMSPSEDPLAQRTHPLTMTEGRDGNHEGTLDETEQDGGYNVMVKVEGHSTVSDTHFQRTRLVGVRVG